MRPPDGTPFGQAAVTGLLALIVFAMTVEPAKFNGSDNFWYVPTAQSLLSDGDFELSGQYAASLRAMAPDDGRAITLPNGRFSYFGFGTSVAIVPVVALGNAVFAEPPGLSHDMRIAGIAARLLAALSVAVCYLVVWRVSRRRIAAGVLSAVLAIATPHLSIHAGGLWSSNVVLLCYLCAIGCLTLPATRQWWAVVPLAFAFYCRPLAALPIALTFGFFIVQRQWRQAIRFAVAGVLLLGMMLLQWKFATGVWLLPYYAGHNFRVAAAAFGTNSRLEAFVGQVVSPNRGLWVFMPVALMSAAGAIRAWRHAIPCSMMFRLLSLWLLCHWIVIAWYPHWWLGHSFGPRAWAEMFGVLVILILPLGMTEQGRVAPRPMVLAMLALLTAAGTFVNVRSAYCHGAAEWNVTPSDVDRNPGRVWDVNDLQIMRARCGR